MIVATILKNQPSVSVYKIHCKINRTEDLDFYIRQLEKNADIRNSVLIYTHLDDSHNQKVDVDLIKLSIKSVA